MLKQVLFMGVREANRLEPSQTTVIISILDQFEEHNRPPRLHEFRDHLILNFVDAFDKPGETHWPDRMSEAEHWAACTWEEDRARELLDALRIVEFVSRHHHATEAMTLVVHCHGGVSRSVAVAQWVGETLGVAMPQLGDGIRWLLRMIAKKGVPFLQRLYLRLCQAAVLSPNWCRMLRILADNAFGEPAPRLAALSKRIFQGRLGILF